MLLLSGRISIIRPDSSMHAVYQRKVEAKTELFNLCKLCIFSLLLLLLLILVLEGFKRHLQADVQIILNLIFIRACCFGGFKKTVANFCFVQQAIFCLELIRQLNHYRVCTQVLAGIIVSILLINKLVLKFNVWIHIKGWKQ